MKTEEGRGALIFLELWTCSGELSVNNDDLGSPSAVKPSFENRWNVMKCENFFYEVIATTTCIRCCDHRKLLSTAGDTIK